MHAKNLGRTLAAGVIVIAAFNTLASLSLPRQEIKPGLLLVGLWLVLLGTHAACYWFANGLRARLGDGWYVALQAALVFSIGLTRPPPPFPVAVGLYVALTIYTVILAGGRWGSVQITFGAILLFAINAIVTSNLYRGAMAGLLLAIAGVVGHAIAALLAKPRADATPAPSPSPFSPQSPSQFGLTARELEVLSALVRGARNREIASQLAITERTVKAHLASIFTKLGVESRTAAIAVATTHQLIGSPERMP